MATTHTQIAEWADEFLTLKKETTVLGGRMEESSHQQERLLLLTQHEHDRCVSRLAACQRPAGLARRWRAGAAGMVPVARGA